MCFLIARLQHVFGGECTFGLVVVGLIQLVLETNWTGQTLSGLASCELWVG